MPKDYAHIAIIEDRMNVVIGWLLQTYGLEADSIQAYFFFNSRSRIGSVHVVLKVNDYICNYLHHYTPAETKAFYTSLDNIHEYHFDEPNKWCFGKKRRMGPKQNLQQLCNELQELLQQVA